MMTKKLFFQLFLCMMYFVSIGQEKNAISGYVYDQKTGEALIGVNVYVKNGVGTQSNEYGYYSLTLEAAKQEITFSYVGFDKKMEQVDLRKPVTLSVRLSESEETLQTVVITETRTKEQERVRSAEMGKIDIPITLLKKAPVLLGESDILKVLQLMPGVKRGSEGQTGMFVRGGGNDQNLILLDEAPVYNVSHLLGFFSVFNTNSLKDVTMYKGAFPANYGGRLSSILDIKMKEGNDQRFTTQGSIGLITSNLTIEAPIIKNKASFIVSGRRTYIDKVFQVFNVPLPYYFYDLNAKVNYKINERDRIYLSSYYGRDVLYTPKIKSDSSSSLLGDDGLTTFIGNFTVSSRWNHIYKNGKMFHNLTAFTSSFKYNIGGKLLENNLSIQSDIFDIGLKLDYDYRPSADYTIRFGTALTNHDFRPNIISVQGDIAELLKNKTSGKLIRNQELAFYGNVEHDLNEKIKLNGGLRLSSSIVQSQFYGGIEPRFSARYQLDKNSSIKFGYARMKQYLHLISSSAVSLPTDLWYPVTKNVKPGFSDQVSVGYFYYLEKLRTNLSVEAYYKTLGNQIEYREGSVLFLNNNYESQLVTGQGRAYGAEFLVQRSHGKWTGWIGYTLSVANRTFPDLNQGKTYYAKYDRRHDFSIVSALDITKRFSFNAAWVYSSGQPFTPSLSQYFMPSPTFTKINILPIFVDRNSVRLSPAHRLDIDFCFKTKKRKRLWEGEWHLSAYNTYARTQPSRIVVTTDPTGKRTYQQKGLFGFIGSISYNFKF